MTTDKHPRWGIRTFHPDSLHGRRKVRVETSSYTRRRASSVQAAMSVADEYRHGACRLVVVEVWPNPTGDRIPSWQRPAPHDAVTYTFALLESFDRLGLMDIHEGPYPRADIPAGD